MVSGSGEHPPQFLRPVRNSPVGRRRGRLSVALRVAGVLLGLALGGAAAYFGHRYAMTSSTFQLRDIVVEEVSPELRDEVRASLAAALGRNLLVLDLEVLRRRVERLPRVSDASVRRLLPDGIEVSVSLRRPFAAVVRDEAVLVIDRDRVLLSRPRTAPAHLPVLRVEVPIEFSTTGSRVEAHALSDAIAVVSWLRTTPPESIRDIDHVRVGPEGVTLVVVDGQLEIVFGDASDLDAKVANLTALYRSDPPLGARQVDVSFRDMVVVRDLGEG